MQTICFGFLLDFLAGKEGNGEHRNELNSLRKLSPFIDEEVVIRVGDRLQRSTLGYAIKHPILLPKRHHLVKLIVFHYHERSHHSGNSYVLALVRQMFWVVNGCFYIFIRTIYEWMYIHCTFLSKDLFLLFFETGQSGKNRY